MSGSFRFGEFQLDVAAYALSRGGTPIKLEKLPMDLLIVLVDRAGTLVDRPAIQAALWGAEVFVDHDAATNTAVRKIRRALGDDADQPRFLETVVGKGYRFIAPVERCTEPAAASAGHPLLSRRHAQSAAIGLIAVAALLWFKAPARPVPAAGATTTIDPASPTAAPRMPSASYNALVRGRHALDKRSESDLRQAIRFFQQSVDADPTCAAAYAGMADSYGQLGYGSYISPDDAFPRARAAARKALDLDQTLAEAHASLGFALMYYDWNFPAAEKEFKQAIALNANYAAAHQWYAYLLTAAERPFGDAAREIGIASDLEPLSVPINIDRAYILYYYGREAEALKSVGRALEMNPKFAPAYFWLGRIYTSEGRYADAAAALEHIGPLRTWTPAMAVRGYLAAKAGRVQEARTILAEFGDLERQHRYASGYAIAVIHAGLGDRERVFSFLDAALRERSHWLVWLKRDPRWNEVRGDPRFETLVRKVGLP